eukprot:7389506-Prymnesium_polylepis.1
MLQDGNSDASNALLAQMLHAVHEMTDRLTSVESRCREMTDRLHGVEVALKTKGTASMQEAAERCPSASRMTWRPSSTLQRGHSPRMKLMTPEQPRDDDVVAAAIGAAVKFTAVVASSAIDGHCADTAPQTSSPPASAPGGRRRRNAQASRLHQAAQMRRPIRGARCAQSEGASPRSRCAEQTCPRTGRGEASPGVHRKKHSP